MYFGKIPTTSSMPLLPNAERLIRGNFSVIKRGKKPRRVTIGHLTQQQADAININRKERGFQALSGEIFFFGTHIFKSRVIKDGYTEEDVLKMIGTAMATECVFVPTSLLSG
jgi:hypothetical protein